MAYSVPSTTLLDKPILQGLTTVGTTQYHDLGYTVTSSTGRKFMYCITSAGGVATILGGHPAYFFQSTTGPTVTSDASDSATTQGGACSAFAGLFCGLLTAATAQYAWVEIPNGAVTPDASVSTNVAVSSAISALGTADAYLDVFLGGASTKVVAIALEAAASNLADIIMLGEGG